MGIFLMKSIKLAVSVVYVCFLALLLLAATERQALAYTDPGTGTLVLQALFAAIAGALFQFRRIRLWFKRRGEKSPAE
jgi:hypothetical protein